MFTGLVECTGLVAARGKRGPAERLTLSAPFADLVLGESISVSGTCLTVVSHDHGSVGGGRAARGLADFEVDISAETLSRTTLGRLQIGSKVNLERALQLGDRLGGHLVSGHVDGLARVLEVRPSGAARSVTCEAPSELAPFLAQKGSVALDGVSLTVNAVTGSRFSVMIIPHTLAVTTLEQCSVGHELNLEVDLVARYVVHYLASGVRAADPDAALRSALERANLV
jgi:riboflavin synthase